MYSLGYPITYDPKSQPEREREGFIRWSNHVKVHFIAVAWWGPTCNVLEYVPQTLSTVKGTKEVQHYFNGKASLDQSLVAIYSQNAFNQFSVANKYIVDLNTSNYHPIISFF